MKKTPWKLSQAFVGGTTWAAENQPDQIGRVSTLRRKILELVSGPWPLCRVQSVHTFRGSKEVENCNILSDEDGESTGKRPSCSWYILFISLMVISCSTAESKINVSEAKFAWDSRKSSKISSEVVIKCEGWACTIVKDFEPAEKTNRSRSRGQGGNKGMYSSSEASVSRADSPVIFVVGLNWMIMGVMCIVILENVLNPN